MGDRNLFLCYLIPYMNAIFSYCTGYPLQGIMHDQIELS